VSAPTAQPPPAPAPQARVPILQAEHLSKAFEVRSAKRLGRKRAVTVLDDISLTVYRGESFGLVGESGCGKSTLARCLLRLLDLSAGRVLFDGVDLNTLDRDELRALRRRMQFVFQDPFASLDPRMSAGAIVEEPLLIHDIGEKATRAEAALQMLADVGLTPEQARRRPHAFSGGQRQRIGIARAFVLRPEVVILDEPISALDVSVQAQVLNLLRTLQEQLGLTYVFISHDLAVAEYFCDRVAVLYLGQVMEVADRATLFHSPLHPYSVSLLSAVPVPRAGGRARRAERPQPFGEVGSVAERPPGCPFEPRCPVGRGRDACRTQRPPLERRGAEHLVACHFPGEMTVAGGVRPTPALSP
jgi:oligopeptide/dipeptide ABC transporter ATP-binding protein